MKYLLAGILLFGSIGLVFWLDEHHNTVNYAKYEYHVGDTVKLSACPGGVISEVISYNQFRTRMHGKQIYGITDRCLISPDPVIESRFKNERDH